jgi:hypothetical protein
LIKYMWALMSSSLLSAVSMSRRCECIKLVKKRARLLMSCCSSSLAVAYAATKSAG